MSKIEWTEETWNPIVGCSVKSPGCAHCYAMGLAGGRLRHTTAYTGLTTISKAGPVWNGKLRLLPERFKQPFRWRRPRRIFVNSMGDLFHENMPEEVIDKVFAVMALAPKHTFQVLTKRPERMRDYVSKVANESVRDTARRLGTAMAEAYFPAPKQDIEWPLPNVWLGTSIEDQVRADERIPPLLETPAAVRFISVEPLLGPIDLSPWLDVDARTGCADDGPFNTLDWVIVGGESGPGARRYDYAWARSIIRQCREAGVPVFHKQLGSNAGTMDGGTWVSYPTDDRKGGDPREWPQHLNVREYPKVAA